MDTDANSIPDFVDTTLTTMTNVHETYVGAGYRPPKPDGIRGGDARTDIYLADIGQDGLYGYCTSDEPDSNRWDRWAYCVLDNDYDPDEFPTNTPLENMRVTAAHEYMHAVQYAYDAFEDGWFMEATATWAEDELFDNVDDNVQYLPSGPLGKPRVPLDLSTTPHWYGDWIFFRYLTERFPTEVGGMPSLVRDMWQRADAIPGAGDEYSLQAVSGRTGRPGGLARADVRPVRRREPPTPHDVRGGCCQRLPDRAGLAFGDAHAGRPHHGLEHRPARPPHQRDCAVRPVEHDDRQQLAAPGPGRHGVALPGVAGPGDGPEAWWRHEHLVHQPRLGRRRLEKCPVRPRPGLRSRADGGQRQ